SVGRPFGGLILLNSGPKRLSTKFVSQTNIKLVQPRPGAVLEPLIIALENNSLHRPKLETQSMKLPICGRVGSKPKGNLFLRVHSFESIVGRKPNGFGVLREHVIAGLDVSALHEPS